MGCSSGPDVVEDGLVLCLDAASKRSYSGSGTTWVDTVGGNNGTLQNGASFESLNAGGIVLDGSNDRIAIDDFEDLNLSDVSFSCGVKVDSLGSDSDFFVKGAHSSSSSIICWYDPSVTGGQQTGNSGAISVLSNDGSTLMFISSSNYIISAGEIFVVDVTIDASIGKISLYKNGQLLVSHENSNYNGMPNNSSAYYLGAESGNQKSLPGRFYFFRAYNKCLSADEVRQNYLSTKERYQ